MYKRNRILCIIPARGGSKGVPGKNVRLICGKPLIGYTIEHARQSKYIDRVVVSTDDDSIAKAALKFKAEVPFKRPLSLAGDTASTIDVLLHCIDWIEKKEGSSFDIIVLLHATTPLRSPEDIDNAIKLMVDKNADNVFSVSESHRNPYFNMVELSRFGYASLSKKGKFTTRQSAPAVYDMNSSIYVWWGDILKKRKAIFLKKSLVYVMPKERSVDIDDTLDLKIAEMLIKVKNND